MIAPKVPPIAKASIPKNIKVKTRASVVPKNIKDSVNNAGDIPKNSRAI